MTTALERLPKAACERLHAVLMGAGNPNNLTAAIVVDTLADKVALVAQHTGVGERGRYDTRQVPELGTAWVMRWDHLTLYVGEWDEVAYVLRVAREHYLARAFLRELVVTTAIDLGIPRRPFLRPAPLGGRRA